MKLLSAEIPIAAEVEIQVFPKPKTGFELLIDMAGGGAQVPAELRSLAALVRRAGLVSGDGVLTLPYVPQL